MRKNISLARRPERKEREAVTRLDAAIQPDHKSANEVPALKTKSFQWNGEGYHKLIFWVQIEVRKKEWMGTAFPRKKERVSHQSTYQSIILRAHVALIPFHQDLAKEVEVSEIRRDWQESMKNQGPDP